MAGWDARGLVTTDWLADDLGDPDLRIFDVTQHLRPSTSGPYSIESGREDYLKGHIPGAAFLDLAGELSDPDSSLNFTMPPVERFAAAMGAAGVRRGVRVVAYSTTAPMWATRLWWMLRASGFDDAAVLDGGFAKWVSEGRPTETTERRYAPAELSLSARPYAWADKEEVLAAIGDGGVCTINALPSAVHSGEAETNYGRKGHIKGSRNVPYSGLMNPDGAWRPDDEIRELFDQVGAMQRPRVICYCGGGISATMDALALTRIGHPSVAVYDGSMSEWVKDPDLPMEIGA
jgi:thiosulfate/3-mercaptopyruvate sulfurtransferase